MSKSIDGIKWGQSQMAYTRLASTHQDLTYTNCGGSKYYSCWNGLECEKFTSHSSVKIGSRI